jgi:Tfp pilus assembly protein PilF
LRRSLVAVACLVLPAAYFAACAVPPVFTLQQLAARGDSLRDSVARARGPAWRAQHYPAADLHGPFERPVLTDTTADPNDPAAYYRLGDSVRLVLPGLADRAYYWATRLDPAFANAYLARWRLLRNDFPWRELPNGSIGRMSPAMIPATDSLAEIAIGYSPFLDGTFDIPRWVSERQASRNPIAAGMLDYSKGDFRAATRDWARALAKYPNAVRLHIPRAYAWVKLGENDSAIADLTALATRVERIQHDSIVGAYYSTAYVYYAIGLLQAEQKHMAEARRAYEQALIENLGFYMAHMRLAAAAAQLRDTTDALSELQTALLIRGDDPLLLVYDGTLLLHTGQIADAEQQLRAALRVDPEFAITYAMLGQAAEARHDTTAALAEYRDYLTRAARAAPERGWVTGRIAALAHR